MSVSDHDTVREVENEANSYRTLCNRNNPDLHGDGIKAI